MQYKDLAAIGLNENESRVYWYLLENGLSTPPQISQGTKILRSNTYHVLRALKEMQLIELKARGKRAAYFARDPGALLHTVARRKESIERMLPDLRALYTVQRNKPKIHFYDGWEEIKQIYLQTLEAEEVYACGSPEHISLAGKEFFPYYIKQLKARGIIFHDILTHVSAPGGISPMANVLGGLYDYKLLAPEHNAMATDMLSWNDQIALITLKEPMFGTVLSSQTLAYAFRVMFKTMQKAL